MQRDITSDPLAEGGIEAFGRRLRNGETTARAVAEAYLERIQALDPILNAFVSIAPDEALEAADALDRLLRSGTDLGPLMGVPVAVKDLFAVDGHPPARAGSCIDVSDCIGAEGSFVRQLRRAGCIILGKTRTIEFAAGAHNLTHPAPWNPIDGGRQLTPGGSSNGSAVAVGAGLCAVAVGTDTGGSVRLPAAFCGVFGLKPSRDVWARDGIFPLCPSMDCVGLLTARARDAAIAFAALGGRRADGRPDLAGVRLGVPGPDCLAGPNPSVTRRYEEALRELESRGARLREIHWPSSVDRREVDEIFAQLVPTDLLATLGRRRVAENRQLIDPVAISRLDGAEYLSAADYARMQRRLQTLAGAASARLAGVDAFVTPTSPIQPVPVEEVGDLAAANAFIARSLEHTRPGNVYAHCAATVPLRGRDGIGLQISRPAGEDAELLSTATAIEAALGGTRRRDPRPFD
ncbi:amidase [Arhodomonas aquaeolei]|uniref:amidase n=1 Tax=Arhodomonas aquaeolei TaxID=2369 RepID=UPI002168FFD5|nr:amidase [Arhodomonas aquaeolei]MCS4504458.1 amidase [Arhodomonas aquaeolei]